ncbi:membrane protein [Caballeronia peredens]|nr:membrane protein [Caballeronia peredens]
MKRTATLVAALASTILVAAAPLARAQTEASSTTMANDLPPVDKAFVQAASSAGSTEIDAARLATKQSQDKDVKDFAHHMMIDHTRLALQLKMAAPHGVTVPMSNSDPSALESLKALHGKDFDDAYIRKVGVQGHQEAVQVFRKEAQEGQNAKLKEAAHKALPTIEQHLKMAQELAAKKGVQ